MAGKVKNDKSRLSKRELEVLQAVSKGLSNQEIARELIISVNTVRVHLRNIFEKLQVQSRTEATMRAVQEGWIIPPAPTDGDSVIGAPTTVDAPAHPMWRPLARWQRIYLAAAVGIAVLVFSTPMLRPLLNKPVRNAITDQASAPILVTPPAPPANEKWIKQADMPAARSRLAVAVYNNELYLIGGERTSGATGLVEMYDPTTQTWREAASKPTVTANMQAVTIGNEIFVPGGCADTADVIARLEIFNPTANTWREGASLPEPLCAYAAASVNGHLYVIGGWNGNEYVNAVYVYSPAEDVWRTLAQVYPLRIGFAAAAAVNSKIYVAGGYDGSNEYADVNILDTTSETWQAGPPLKHPRGGLGLVALGDTLYAVGGGWTTMLTNGEKLPLAGNAWQGMDTPYVSEWRNFGLVTINHEMFAVGGWNGKHLNTVMSFKTPYKVFIPLSY